MQFSDLKKGRQKKKSIYLSQGPKWALWDWRSSLLFLYQHWPVYVPWLNALSLKLLTAWDTNTIVCSLNWVVHFKYKRTQGDPNTVSFIDTNLQPRRKITIKDLFFQLKLKTTHQRIYSPTNKRKNHNPQKLAPTKLIKWFPKVT